MKLLLRLATASALALTVNSMAHASDLDDIGDLNPDGVSAPMSSDSGKATQESSGKSTGKANLKPQSLGLSAELPETKDSNGSGDALERESLPKPGKAPNIADDLSPDGPRHEGPSEPVLPTYPSQKLSRAAAAKQAAHDPLSKKKQAAMEARLAKAEKKAALRKSKLMAKSPKASAPAKDLYAADTSITSPDGIERAVNPSDSSDVPASDIGSENLVDNSSSRSQSRQAQDPTKNLDQKNEMLSIDGEVAEADQASYDLINTDNAAEVRKLQEEVKALERQTRGSQRSADLAKNRAQLTEKRLQLQNKLKQQAQALLAQQQRAQHQHESQLNRLRNKVQSTESKLADARAKAKETERAIHDAKKEQASLELRLKMATRRMKEVAKARADLKSKQAKIAQKNRQLKHDVARAEAKAEPKPEAKDSTASKPNAFHRVMADIF